MIKSKRPILELSKVFGWFNEDKLISQIAVYPCEVNIHGKLIKMGGVTGVGTYPEYAGHGLMKDLIKLALETMRKTSNGSPTFTLIMCPTIVAKAGRLCPTS